MIRPLSQFATGSKREINTFQYRRVVNVFEQTRYLNCILESIVVGAHGKVPSLDSLSHKFKPISLQNVYTITLMDLHIEDPSRNVTLKEIAYYGGEYYREEVL